MGDVTRSCLLTARDLGRGWKTTNRFYTPKWKVKRPLIDGGIEEDGAHCSTMNLMGSPDGVKIDQASHLVMFDRKADSGRIYVTAAAAIFPAEANARARTHAYAAAIRHCQVEMRSVFAGWQTPRREKRSTSVTTSRLKLPVEGFALRTLTRHTSGGTSDYRDVVIQRGRMVAGFAVHGHEEDFKEIDIGRLSQIVARRLERALATLRPSRVRIPVYTSDPVADRIARSALLGTSDFPARWRDHAVMELGYSSGADVFPGSAMLGLDRLSPEHGMVGRAVAPLAHVGWSQYIRHHVAVYTSERRAKSAAKDAFDRTFPRRRQRRPAARARITAGPVESLDVDRDVRARFCVKTYHMPAWRDHEPMDVTSSDTVAIIRRGRMVATYALAAKDVDVELARKLLLKVVRKLERAERALKR